MGATLLFGLLPAMRGTRQDAGEALSARGRTVAPAASRLQWLLVGVQVALAVPLLFGAGLLLRSFDALGRVSPGFEPGRVLTFRISGNYGETVNMQALSRRIDATLESLRAVPGIEAAATSLAIPGVPFRYQTELRFSDGQNSRNQRIMANSRVVSAGYFTTMRIPVLAGEACSETSTVSSALVNRRFAALYHPGDTPVGRYLEQVPPNPFLKAARIVGVAGDAREEGLNEAATPIVYWCNSAPMPAPLFLVRTRDDPTAMAQTVRRRVHALEPQRSVYEVTTLEDRIDESVAENRLRTTLLSLFGVTAVVLAAIGLYGTLSYVVSMRRREIGVRMAMGALRSQIAASFLWQGIGVSVAGCVAGLWLAAALGRALSGMLYAISPLDGLTFVGVVLLMGIIAVCSSVWPAIRAARTEPIHDHRAIRQRRLHMLIRHVVAESLVGEGRGVAVRVIRQLRRRDAGTDRGQARTCRGAGHRRGREAVGLVVAVRRRHRGAAIGQIGNEVRLPFSPAPALTPQPPVPANPYERVWPGTTADTMRPAVSTRTAS